MIAAAQNVDYRGHQCCRIKNLFSYHLVFIWFKKRTSSSTPYPPTKFCNSIYFKYYYIELLNKV